MPRVIAAAIRAPTIVPVTLVKVKLIVVPRLCLMVVIIVTTTQKSLGRPGGPCPCAPLARVITIR